MARHFRRLATLSVLALLVTPVVAQHAHGPQHPPLHGPDMTLHERLFSRLDLSDEQRQRIEQLINEHRDMTEDLVVREKEARAAVAEQMHAAEFDEGAIRAAVFTAAETEADLAVERARLHQQIRQELTDAQRERLDEMAQRRQRFLEQGRGYHDGRHFRPMEPRPKGLDED